MCVYIYIYIHMYIDMYIHMYMHMEYHNLYKIPTAGGSHFFRLFPYCFPDFCQATVHDPLVQRCPTTRDELFARISTVKLSTPKWMTFLPVDHTLDHTYHLSDSIPILLLVLISSTNRICYSLKSLVKSCENPHEIHLMEMMKWLDRQLDLSFPSTSQSDG